MIHPQAVAFNQATRFGRHAARNGRHAIPSFSLKEVETMESRIAGMCEFWAGIAANIENLDWVRAPNNAANWFKVMEGKLSLSAALKTNYVAYRVDNLSSQGYPQTMRYEVTYTSSSQGRGFIEDEGLRVYWKKSNPGRSDRLDSGNTVLSRQEIRASLNELRKVLQHSREPEMIAALNGLIVDLEILLTSFETIKTKLVEKTQYINSTATGRATVK